MTRAGEVVITGIGLTIPPGVPGGDPIDRALRGESGIGPLRRFDATGHLSAAAGEVPPFELGATLRTPKNEKFMGHAVCCAVRAAAEAIAGSGIDPSGVDPYRFGIYTGCGQTGLDTTEFFAALELAETGEEGGTYRNLGGRASRLVDRYWSLRTLANGGLGLLAAELSARGPCNNFVQGDTASAQALAAGYFDLLERRCDLVLAGGYESLLSVSTYLAYERAGLLSPSGPERAYRPFDRSRDGLVLGEGAAFIVLERGEDARRRGATPLAELIGVGLSQHVADAGHPSEALESPRAAIREAAGDVRPDFVVARGIGTRDDDRREAAAFAALGLRDTPVTALKGLTGYLGAATAVVELSVGVLAARRGAIPPVTRLDAPDDDCPIDLVVGDPRPLAAPAPSLLTLSRSWSGQCAALAARVIAA